VADQPINYSIEDYAVWFFVKPPEMAAMETRKFHVDPNTFVQGLRGVYLTALSGMANTTGGGGGGGYGGGGYGGGGLWRRRIWRRRVWRRWRVWRRHGRVWRRHDGRDGRDGRIWRRDDGWDGRDGRVWRRDDGWDGRRDDGRRDDGGGSSQGSVSYPAVSAAMLPNITQTNSTYLVNAEVSSYFMSMGINLTPTNNGSFVVFNDRTGDILVRATKNDLDIVEQVIEMLNKTPPEVQIDVKYASVTQTDTKGVNFNWYLGNFTLNNGAIGGQAGTAPSYTGNPTLANPSGIFPGPGPIGSPGQIARPPRTGS